jgi:hypothetical protein
MGITPRHSKETTFVHLQRYTKIKQLEMMSIQNQRTEDNRKQLTKEMKKNNSTLRIEKSLDSFS